MKTGHKKIQFRRLDWDIQFNVDMQMDWAFRSPSRSKCRSMEPKNARYTVHNLRYMERPMEMSMNLWSVIDAVVASSAPANTREKFVHFVIRPSKVGAVTSGFVVGSR